MAEGDLVVFTDDDAVPRPDWLTGNSLCCRFSPVLFRLFGGTVVPGMVADPSCRVDPRLGPAWPSFWHYRSRLERRTDCTRVPLRTEHGNPRAEVFEAGYRFNVGIGPRGRNYSMGSETELTLRLARAGFESWHCKQAVVEHMVRKSQMNQEWIFGRAKRFGRSKYRLWIQHENVQRKKYLGVPRYLIREIAKKGLDVGHAKLSGDPASLFEKRWVLNYLLGQAIEARLIHKEFHSAGSM